MKRPGRGCARAVRRARPVGGQPGTVAVPERRGAIPSQGPSRPSASSVVTEASSRTLQPRRAIRIPRSASALRSPASQAPSWRRASVLKCADAPPPGSTSRNWSSPRSSSTELTDCSAATHWVSQLRSGFGSASAPERRRPSRAAGGRRPLRRGAAGVGPLPGTVADAELAAGPGQAGGVGLVRVGGAHADHGEVVGQCTGGPSLSAATSSSTSSRLAG